MEGALYERRLSVESIDVLRGVLGRSVCTFYSSHLDVMGRHVAASALSLSLFEPNQSVTIRADYFETPHTMTDYWQMHVHQQRYPHGVEIQDGAMFAPCSITLFPSSPISAIEIYEAEGTAREKSEIENVLYDQAIIFRRVDGKFFCMACHLNGPGIAEDIHYTDDDVVLSQLLEISRLRLVLS
jgi:hypothetical protein